MIAHEAAEASPAHDTPKTPEVVARSLPELHDLLTRPRTAGEPLTVLLEGPAAAQIFGETMAVRVVAVDGGAVAA
ncbi:hypothetical protein [Mycolicibacterium austroafricanum]|uniref:hypothetical protein n=1 Tax=Mycolicibacterium austroafricanum TaxID=39687 RepID=UPI001CA365A6|nr:hypothetical protein [Mycolicibacterium austroafricanum]QZT56236.1 hypothetical protein JN084_25475 [Mycolicibacterium austroafricanum]